MRANEEDSIGKVQERCIFEWLFGHFQQVKNLGSQLANFLIKFHTCRIMVSYSDKIKTEAFDNFDNFILQSVLPSDYEVEGIQKHNQ